MSVVNVENVKTGKAGQFTQEQWDAVQANPELNRIWKKVAARKPPPEVTEALSKKNAAKSAPATE